MYIKVIEDLDLEQISRSGQCFRWQEIKPHTYSVIAFGRYLEISQQGNRFEFRCSEEEFHSTWKSYLDMDTDYQSIKKRLLIGEDTFLKLAVWYGSGIRILRQDLWEMIVSFLISQNNNIPRIRKNIEALCEKFGKPIYEGNICKGYAFPKPEVLADLGPDGLRELGLGYRDRYVLSAAKWYVKERDGAVRQLKQCGNAKEQKGILKNAILGVGDKVADCIVLFGLHGMDNCPIDTWMKKLIEEDYGGKKPVWMEGSYAGLFQQYAFYYKRETKSS